MIMLLDKTGNGDWFEISNSTRRLKLVQKTVIKVTLFVSSQELQLQIMDPVGNNDAGYTMATLTVNGGCK